MFLSQNGYFALKIGKISLEFLHFPAIIGKGFIPTLYFYEGLLVTMERKFSQFHNGLRDGVPIGLGYLAVSFTFGIAAQLKGLTVFQSVLMSFTNLTSAGQFAALGVIQTGAPYIELALIQIIINLRYCLMSFSLSQKLEPGQPFFHRFFLAFGVADEVFGLSACRPGLLNPFYYYGLMAMAIPGWTAGTFLGAVSGELLSARILNALGVALYGMFIAVIIPPAKSDRVIAALAAISMVLSLAASCLPPLSSLSSGLRIILLTLLIAGAAAFLFPIKEESNHES